MKSVSLAYGIFVDNENHKKILRKFTESLTFEQKSILFLGWDPKKSIESNILEGDDREDDFEKFTEDNYEDDPDFMVNFFGETSIFDFIDRFRENYPGISVTNLDYGKTLMIYLNSSHRKFEEGEDFEISEIPDFNEEEKNQLQKFIEDFDLEIELKKLSYTTYF